MNTYTYNELNEGMTECFCVTITEDMMDAFRSLTGDVNPLHADNDFAKEKGYDGKVCFGMLTASFLSTLAGVYLPGKYSLIQSVEVKFSKPVFPGEELEISGKVTEKNDTFRFIKVKAEAKTVSGEKKMKAVMQIGVMA
ncbi:MAG: MaoC family dehydratase N-terminal domain-containing protein [Parasporobacterium sp.]|nr:MaoC family dehydratase N-terminal domain-containing protein [Parasporobacterium sp.]MBR3641958.1 MaoC family dehydratase N-terminal domain-containing protein [Parasporobacterium sp.]